MRSTRDVAERFWSHVHIGGVDECWPWTGATYRKGYGNFGLRRGLNVSAHRFAYELSQRAPAPELDVCHACDNPPCCNPRHLFEGSRAVNMQDASGKGRLHRPETKGEANGNAKLTRATVEEIRAAAGTTLQRDLAARYGVSKSLISAIVRREVWA